MRDIKFRAWHRHDGMQTPWLEIIDGGACQAMTGKPDEIMQFTGLKDKNGAEIYEGDLIELFENKKGCAEVVFLNDYVGGWNLAFKNEFASLGARNQQDLEVIGNIHENPELLEKEK